MDRTVLEKIYDQLKTPYKYGTVLKLDGRMTDSPIVFKKGKKYYMSFVSIDNGCKTGYSTHIAESDDLLHWNVLGEILSGHSEWDSAQSGGYAQLQDNSFGGSNELFTVDGEYLFAYIGGNLEGYETDPLSMGLSFAKTPIGEFTRFENPIMTPSDSDARQYETN